MRLRATLLLLLVTGLVAATAAAAAAPPYYWWTNTHANRAVAAKNFQLWSHQGQSPHSTITRSACKGYGLAKRTSMARYYRHFICAATWTYDTPDSNYGSGPFKSPLICSTTKAKPLGLACRLSA